MNWNKIYNANKVYSQSKLAQMMFAYELRDRLKSRKEKDSDVKIFVCHPGASATSLISTSGGACLRATWWLISKTKFVQSAEKGAYPEVMCATEDELVEQQALYGPTGMMEIGGPVRQGTLNSHAYQKDVITKLWEVSEKATGFTWNL